MKKTIHFKAGLHVSILREGKYFVAYSPALDLSTSGKTLAEAQRHFTEAAEIFLEETARHGTLESVLTDLGWRKSKISWQPPVVVSQSTQLVRVPAC